MLNILGLTAPSFLLKLGLHYLLSIIFLSSTIKEITKTFGTHSMHFIFSTLIQHFHTPLHCLSFRHTLSENSENILAAHLLFYTQNSKAKDRAKEYMVKVRFCQ